MNDKKTQFEKIKELQREYYCRNQSERILDKHVFNKKNLKDIFSLEEEIYCNSSQKQKEEKEQTCKKLFLKKIIVFTTEDALEKILKSLKNEQKAIIAVDKIKKIFDFHLSYLHGHHIIQTLFELSKCQAKYKGEEIKKKQLEIYLLIDDKKQELIDESLHPIFEMLLISLKIHPNLYTDDSYQLSDSLLQLKKKIEELKEIKRNADDGFQFKGHFKICQQIISENLSKKQTNQEQINIKQKIAQKLQIKKQEQVENQQNQLKPDVNLEEQNQNKLPKYEFEFGEEMKILLVLKSWEKRFEWRQTMIINCVKDLVVIFKKQWAKSMVSQFLSNLHYNENDIFNEDQRKVIESTYSLISNMAKNSQTIEKQTQIINSKIVKDYSRPQTEIVDTRAVRVVTDNTNVWVAKQHGL